MQIFRSAPGILLFVAIFVLLALGVWWATSVGPGLADKFRPAALQEQLAR